MRETIRCKSIRRVDSDLHVSWSDKSVDVYPNRVAMKAFIRQTVTPEVVKALCLAAILFDDDTVPLTRAAGKRVTFDTASPQLLTVVDAP